MWTLVTQTLVIAAVAVLGMLAVFISFRDVLLIAVCIGCVDCSMMGMMAIWGVALETRLVPARREAANRFHHMAQT